MNKYYIIREDGTSVFMLPYEEEFIYHCLIHLIDRTPNERYRLCQIGSSEFDALSVSAFFSLLFSD